MGNKGKILLNVVLALIAGVLIFLGFDEGNEFMLSFFLSSFIGVFGLIVGVFSILPLKPATDKWFFTIFISFAGALALMAIAKYLPGTYSEVFNIGLGFFTSGAALSLLVWTKVLKTPRKVVGGEQ